MKDKVVIVTGGANGIGKAIVKTFAQLEAKVIVVDIDKEQGLILQNGSKNICFYSCDLRIEKEINTLFDWIKKEYNRCDILINNAGVSKFKNFFDIKVEEFDDVLNINLRGTFLMSQQFAGMNKFTSYGRIINISSTRYSMSEENSEAYAASKGGVVSLTHALALSLSKTAITVNCISPGWIETKDYEHLTESDHYQHPSRRVGTPQDIANMCVFLCQEDNDFINGENIIIDGGMTKKMIYV